MVAFGAFRIDAEEERLWKGAKQLSVRRKPFAILRYLVTNPRRVVTHGELLEHVWGGTTVSESAVRTHLHELRQLLGEGIIETVIGRGYRFTAEIADAAPATGSQPIPRIRDRLIVGRDAELELLRAAFERARGGHREMCFLTGDPGIGKTTLVDELFDDFEHADAIALRGQCVEQHGTPEPYLAIIEMLGRLRHARHGEDALAAIVRHAPSFLAQTPHLLTEAQLVEVSRRGTGSTEARMMRELVEAFEAIASQFSLVLVVEDLQWSDVATIDVLNVLGQRTTRARLLVIATARRAEAQTVSHPLNRVMRTLIARSGATAVALEPLPRSEIGRFIDTRFPGHTLPKQLGDGVERVTRGTPLFVSTLLDDLVERGMIAERAGAWQLVATLDDIAAHRPANLAQLIDIQLDRLAPQEQRVLEAASIVGVDFATTLVAAALELPEEQLDELCDSLARRSLFLRRAPSEDWPDGSLQTRYTIMHGLVQDACTERCPPARRQRWHRMIAERLEHAYGDRADEVSHVLAKHFDQGAALPRALHYYVIAAERTARRFAGPDTIILFRRALDLCLRTPETAERDRIELRILHGMSATVLRNSDPSGEPLAMFERMIVLARRLDEQPALAAVLINTSVRMSTLADYRRGLELCDEVDAIARAHPLDDRLLAYNDSARVIAAIWLGDLPRALALLERLTERPLSHDDRLGILGPSDRRAVMTAYLSLVRWLLGFADRARVDAARALELATATGDPYTLGLSYCNLARLAIVTGEPPEYVREMATTVLAMANADMWHPQAAMIVTWADSRDGSIGDAAAERLVTDYRGRIAAFPMGTSHLALPVVDALRASGRSESAKAIVDEVIAKCRTRGERLLESELVRLRGEIVEPIDRAAAAADYREAIELAAAIGAISLELCAANRLARLDPAALARVESVLALFTEGFATHDVVEARRLLSSRTPA